MKCKIIWNYSIGWTLAFLFLVIIRGVGATEDGDLKFDTTTGLLVSLPVGLLFGAISGYAQILTEQHFYKKTPLGKLLVGRILFALLFMSALILLNYAVYTLIGGNSISLAAFAFNGYGSLVMYFYWVCVDLFMALLRQVSLMLGEGNLTKLLRGKFYYPTEEERIFMFLDLQSSTHLAEKLGHVQYSFLLQDCFDDLGVVDQNRAQVYQYVGDEVILTWNLRDGLNHQYCLRAYYNFKTRLESRKQYYQQRYGCFPFFKAGLHSGKVIVTEIGKLKKEIAYHGDTLNTAARIQEKCNDFQQELLISDHLRRQLNGSRAFDFTPMGTIRLKGKQTHTQVYAVLPQADPGEELELTVKQHSKTVDQFIQC